MRIAERILQDHGVLCPDAAAMSIPCLFDNTLSVLFQTPFAINGTRGKLLTIPGAGAYNPNVRIMHVVNQDRCTGCGSCADICPTEAIRIENGKASIGMECMDCGACPRVCPEGAIRKQTVPSPAQAGLQ